MFGVHLVSFAYGCTIELECPLSLDVLLYWDNIVKVRLVASGFVFGRRSSTSIVSTMPSDSGLSVCWLISAKLQMESFLAFSFSFSSISLFSLSRPFLFWNLCIWSSYPEFPGSEPRTSIPLALSLYTTEGWHSRGFLVVGPLLPSFGGSAGLEKLYSSVVKPYWTEGYRSSGLFPIEAQLDSELRDQTGEKEELLSSEFHSDV